MEPVSASVFAYISVGEVLTNIQLTGAILIVFATVVAELRFKRKLKHTL
jgi:drug/metabolite transporter (DMT)-like permease